MGTAMDAGKRDPEVVSAINHLHSSIERMTDAVTRHIERVEEVLSDPVPTPESPDKVVGVAASSKLACTIHDLAGRLDHVARTLATATERVEV